MAGNGRDLPILCYFLLISAWEGVEKSGGGEGLQRAAAGPAAEPPTRAKPVCFDAVETACGPVPPPAQALPQQQAGAHQPFPGAGAHYAVRRQPKQPLECRYGVFGGGAVDAVRRYAGQRVGARKCI